MGKILKSTRYWYKTEVSYKSFLTEEGIFAYPEQKIVSLRIDYLYPFQEKFIPTEWDTKHCIKEVVIKETGRYGCLWLYIGKHYCQEMKSRILKYRSKRIQR